MSRVEAEARATPATSLWREPDFLKLWSGQAISLLGSQVTLVALPLVAILSLEASPLQVGLLAAAAGLPALLVGLPAGVWADRGRRRPLLIAADLARALALLGIPVAALTGQLSLGYLYLVALVVGGLTILFDVAAAAYLPNLVGRRRLVEAGGALSVGASTAEVAGPGLAGVLVQWLTAPLAIAVDALSFLLSAACLATIGQPEPRPAAAPSGRRFWPDVVEGFRLVLGDRLLRPLVLATGWVTFWSNVLEAIALLYLTRGLGLAPALVGLIMAVANVGLLLGALTAPRLTGRLGVGPVLVMALLVTGLADLATPLVGGSGLVTAAPLAAVAVLTAAQFLFGLAVVLFNVTAAGLRQAGTPDALRGRMAATTRVLVLGLTPLGSLAGGLLGEWIGPQATLVLAAVGEALAALLLLASPVRSLRELPAPAEEVPVLSP